MARNDVKIVEGEMVARKYRTQAAATAILPGEPVAISGSYVVPLATATPTAAAKMLGIAKSASSHSATADGTVDVVVVEAGRTLMRAQAQTPANVDTDAEVLAVLNDFVSFDLTSSSYTINEDEAGAAGTQGLRIVDVDAASGAVDFVLLDYGSDHGSIS